MRKLKNIHIVDSYKVWNPSKMRNILVKAAYATYKHVYTEKLLNRSYSSMYIEWWLHNIGYYLTLPFVKLGISWIRDINLRCKDVDLEEWMEWQK